MNTNYHVEYLKTEFDRRKAVNKRYSLRKYAQDLGLQAPTLSHVIRGIRPLPWRYLKTVARSLKLEGSSYRQFVRSVNSRVLLAPRLSSVGFTESYKLSDKLHAEIIEDWEHYALLGYLNTNGKQDFQTIANRFDLTVSRVEKVLNNLAKAGLVTKKNNRLVKSKMALQTSEDIVSMTLRNAHMQELELVKQKMNLDPLLRDISSISFAGNAEKMKIAKRMIRDFRKKINFLMEDEKKEDVFLLAIQLVPLTKPVSKEV